jgi:hypothetical protein
VEEENNSSVWVCPEENQPIYPYISKCGGWETKRKLDEQTDTSRVLKKKGLN